MSKTVELSTYFQRANAIKVNTENTTSFVIPKTFTPCKKTIFLLIKSVYHSSAYSAVHDTKKIWEEKKAAPNPRDKKHF